MSRTERVAVALTRRWVAAYTSALPPADRERRRLELESDVWEQRRDGLLPTVAASTVGWQVLQRLVTGVPADLTWRFAAGGAERRASGLLAALLGGGRLPAGVPAARRPRPRRPGRRGGGVLRRQERRSGRRPHPDLVERGGVPRVRLARVPLDERRRPSRLACAGAARQRNRGGAAALRGVRLHGHRRLARPVWKQPRVDAGAVPARRADLPRPALQRARAVPGVDVRARAALARRSRRLPPWAVWSGGGLAV